ncbi:MAG: AMP-binding protein [Actinobacteria bacterium]|nr:AMP-binding protein [Actinomycetota bacterium]
MSPAGWSGRLVSYPAEAVARYRAAGLWGTATIAGEFRTVADRVPGHLALVTAEGRLTYRELDEQADRLAAGLTELGLAPGDRVILQLSNRLITVVTWYGLLKAGLIPVCTLAAHRGHEIGAISRRTQAVAHIVDTRAGRFDLVAFAREQQQGHPTLRHVLTTGADDRDGGRDGGIRVEDLLDRSDPAEGRKVVDNIQAGIDADDVAVFQLSGGTTGVPKIIPRLHAEYWYNARAFAAVSGFTEETRNGHLIPVIHNAGVVIGMHAPHSAGGAMILTGPDLGQALPLLAAEGVTDILLGHGHYDAVRNPAFPALTATLRRALLSGAKVPPPLFERLEQLGVWAGQTFGMGEGFFAVSQPDSDRAARLTTVGTPMSPLDEFRVLAPGTEDQLPDGETGELATRGPYTLRGYFDAPEQNRSAFTTDGFYRTGDLVRVRVFGAERCISVEGRIKDMINRGGEKISAEEVEGLLMRHPLVRAAAVVAMPDPRLGERTCAYLVTEGTVALGEVQQHLARLGVAKFKWPERIEQIAELPKTSVGKVDKKRLRQDIAAKLRPEQGDHHEPRPVRD